MPPRWLALAGSLLVAACNAEKPKPPPKPQPPFNANTTITEAVTEFRSKVSLLEGLLVVRDEFGVDTLTVFPNVPNWRLTCGVTGIQFVLLPGPGADASQVRISDDSRKEEECYLVVAKITSAIRATIGPPR